MTDKKFILYALMLVFYMMKIALKLNLTPIQVLARFYIKCTTKKSIN